MDYFTGLDKEILRREESISRLRPEYQKQSQAVQEFDYTPLVDVLFSYKAGESPEKAIYVLAQCQTLLIDQFRSLRAIKNFENLQAQLEKLKVARPVEQQEKN